QFLASYSRPQERFLTVELTSGLPVPYSFNYCEAHSGAWIWIEIRKTGSSNWRYLPSSWLYQDWNLDESMNKRLDTALTMGTYHQFFDNQVKSENYPEYFNAHENGGWDGNYFYETLNNNWNRSSAEQIIAGDGDYYSAYARNYLYIEKDGRYKVDLISDDGSLLFLDESFVLGDYLHGAMSMSKTLTLSQGFHLFEHFYRENQGHSSMYIHLYIDEDDTDGESWVEIPLENRFYTTYLNHLMPPITSSTFTTLSVRNEQINLSTLDTDLHLLTPSNNQLLKTGTPEFTWLSPSANLVHRIKLRHDGANTELGSKLPIDNPDVTWALLPGEINWTVESGLAKASYTPSWMDSLSPGAWSASVYSPELNEESNVQSFVLDPPLKIDGVLNYPNPFKESTNIRYKLSKSVNRVRIQIFSIAGALVQELEGDTDASSVFKEYHSVIWDGTNKYGKSVVNGVYIYKLIAEGEKETKTMMSKLFKMK
ncbi:T9SS type A sorting domain-containing protein, partial [bacterium]|nr:T9SS type A sorting domain-containing protein [bacterium]